MQLNVPEFSLCSEDYLSITNRYSERFHRRAYHIVDETVAEPSLSDLAFSTKCHYVI